jgi:hypothetical protein
VVVILTPQRQGWDFFAAVGKKGSLKGLFPPSANTYIIPMGACQKKSSFGFRRWLFFAFGESENQALGERKSVKNGRRNLHQLRAISERSDGRRMDFQAAEKVIPSTTILGFYFVGLCC